MHCVGAVASQFSAISSCLTWPVSRSAHDQIVLYSETSLFQIEDASLQLGIERGVLISEVSLH